jgi:hypothetical protein
VSMLRVFDVESLACQVYFGLVTLDCARPSEGDKKSTSNVPVARGTAKEVREGAGGSKAMASSIVHCSKSKAALKESIVD